MAKRLLLLLALGAVAAAPAFAGLGDRKADIDARLAGLRSSIAQHQALQRRLNGQIEDLTTQIRGLERRVGDVSSQLSALQQDLELRQRRLAKLNELWKVQTARLGTLKQAYRLSVRRLNLRLVNMYKQNAPTAVDVVLQSRSFDDVLDQLDYLGAVARQDKKIAFEVGLAKRQVKLARARTLAVKQGVAQQARAISAREQQQRYLRDQLLASRGALAGTKAAKSGRLRTTRARIAADLAESQSLEAASAEIEARLRAAAEKQAATEKQAPTDEGTPTAPPPPASSGGLIWPVSAPITSPFGPRWGRLHAGLDLAAPMGTPIRAAAAGTVLVCGWMSGYGYIVVIDHGNGLATAYAHQSRIAAACNQQVAQGQTIGYVGNSGISTGPHVHFEVRLRGTPVDPLGYLP